MKRPLSRVALAVLFSAILGVVAILPAAADGPIYRGPSSAEPGTATGICSFPFDFAVVKQSKTDTIWYRDGIYTVHRTGGGVYSWSNPASGITLYTTLHGNVVEIYYPDGSATYIWEGNHYIPAAGYFRQGRVEANVGPDGILMSVTVAGRLGDYICDALSS